MSRFRRASLGDDFGYARKLRPEKMDAAVLKAAISKVPPEAVMRLGFHAGSVEEVAAQLKPYIEGGLEYLGLVDYAIWADPSLEMAEQAADNMKRLIAMLQD